MTGSRTLAAVIACVFAATAPASAQGIQYQISSEKVYDAAKVLDNGAFQESKLLEIFKSFSATHCGRQPLARLTVAPSQRDLLDGLNSDLPELPRAAIPNLLSADSTLLCGDRRRSTVAQVLCFGGDATALVLQNGPPDVKSRDPHPLPDSLQVFLQARSLPDLESAARVRRDLEEAIGVRTTVVLRTDSFFFDYDGPRCNVFDVPTASISKEEFLARPFVMCAPGVTRRDCFLLRSHSESVASQVASVPSSESHRNLPSYDKAGPFALEDLDMEARDAAHTAIREFLWEHYQAHRLGQVIVTDRTKEGEPSTD